VPGTVGPGRILVSLAQIGEKLIVTEDDTFEALRRPLTEDEVTFGRGKWVYCTQHMRPHLTGWCTVANRNKTLLVAPTDKVAYNECRERGFELYRDTE
jgi:hypothetical protein